VRTIAFLNKKGGVGKTSTCHHLAGTLARRGQRILLVDADPQASLTQGLLGPEVARQMKPRETIAALFDEASDADMADLIRPIAAVPGVSLVAGSGRMDRYNALEPWTTGDSQYILRDALREVAGDFDLALIDCPPNLHLCSWAALVASDHIVVPLQAEDFGSQGLIPVLDAIAAVQGGPNPGMGLAGFLLTMFDRRLGVHVAYEAMLRDLYGADVFAAVVPRAKDFVEAVAARRPVGLYKPKSAAAKSLAAVADELLVRAGLVARNLEERGAA
jgi:chromosome partitioning protein